jgi:hypothetical protein
VTILGQLTHFAPEAPSIKIIKQTRVAIGGGPSAVWGIQVKHASGSGIWNIEKVLIEEFNFSKPRLNAYALNGFGAGVEARVQVGLGRGGIIKVTASKTTGMTHKHVLWRIHSFCLAQLTIFFGRHIDVGPPPWPIQHVTHHTQHATKRLPVGLILTLLNTRVLPNDFRNGLASSSFASPILHPSFFFSFGVFFSAPKGRRKARGEKKKKRMRSAAPNPQQGRLVELLLKSQDRDRGSALNNAHFTFQPAIPNVQSIRLGWFQMYNLFPNIATDNVLAVTQGGVAPTDFPASITFPVGRWVCGLGRVSNTDVRTVDAAAGAPRSI